MSKTALLTALAFAVLISCGCVNRTITDERPRRDGDNAYGSSSKSKIKEQKRVWIWQKEFRNP